MVEATLEVMADTVVDMADTVVDMADMVVDMVDMVMDMKFILITDIMGMVTTTITAGRTMMHMLMENKQL